MSDENAVVKVVNHPDPNQRATADDIKDPNVVLVSTTGRELVRTKGGGFKVSYRTPPRVSAI